MLALCCVATPAQARSWQAGLEGSVERLDSVMRYRYYLPADYDPAQEYPLVLYLHGSGGAGTDNSTHVGNNPRVLIDKTESEYPAILVAPQLATASGWSVFNQQDLTLDVLDEVLTNYSVDFDRLYITGLSMGGFGTMHYLHVFNAINPDALRFAAAAPIAGAGVEESLAPALQGTPVWLVHGDRDTAVDVAFSQESYNLLTGAERDAAIDFPVGSVGAGGPLATSGVVRYTEYPGVGHNSWSRFYASDDFYEWMFAQSLSSTIPEPSSVVLVSIACLVGAGRRRVR